MVETAGSTPRPVKTRRGWESESLSGRLLARLREAAELCACPPYWLCMAASGEWPTVRNGVPSASHGRAAALD